MLDASNVIFNYIRMKTKTDTTEGGLKSAGDSIRSARYANVGRPRGATNKATATAREAIAMFVDDNTHRLEEMLDKIKDGIPVCDARTGEPIYNSDGSIKWLVEPNPKGAFDAMQSVIEYHIPKLARVEQTGINGGPIAMASLVAGLDLKGLGDTELQQVLALLGRSK